MTNGPSRVGKCKDVPAIFFRIFYQQNVEVTNFTTKKKKKKKNLQIDVTINVISVT